MRRMFTGLVAGLILLSLPISTAANNAVRTAEQP
jgi:hypothetical protein